MEAMRNACKQLANSCGKGSLGSLARKEWAALDCFADLLMSAKSSAIHLRASAERVGASLVKGCRVHRFQQTLGTSYGIIFAWRAPYRGGQF